MRQLKRFGLVFGVVAVSTLFDQWSKQIAIDEFRGRPPVIYLYNFFRFDYAENPGAFLSLGASLSPEARLWTLSIAVAVFLAALAVYVVRTRSMSRVQTLALSLVLGGGVSNLIDRFFRPSGRVVDFMNMGIGSLRTGVFNIADMLIMAGIFVFLFTNLAQAAEEKRSR
ncbi:MAG: signal peptidase II [Oligoflexia bacterium]|nr:signal peptidase II [Oligoflexia bacterium]